MPYTRLLEGSEPGPTLVRREELSPQTEGNGHYRVYCYFQGGPERSFELFYMELIRSRKSPLVWLSISRHSRVS